MRAYGEGLARAFKIQSFRTCKTILFGSKAPTRGSDENANTCFLLHASAVLWVAQVFDRGAAQTEELFRSALDMVNGSPMFRYDRSSAGESASTARFTLTREKTHCAAPSNTNLGNADTLQGCAERCRTDRGCRSFLYGLTSGVDGNRHKQCYRSATAKECTTLYSGIRSWNWYTMKPQAESTMAPYAYYRRLTPLPPSAEALSVRRLMVHRAPPPCTHAFGEVTTPRVLNG